MEALGLGVGFTVTVPLAFRDGELNAAGECIRKARRHLNDGQYDAAIGEVRRAVERVKPLAQWPAISKNDDPTQRSQAQRWEAIRKAVFDFDQASGANARRRCDEVLRVLPGGNRSPDRVWRPHSYEAVPVPQN